MMEIISSRLTPICRRSLLKSAVEWPTMQVCCHSNKTVMTPVVVVVVVVVYLSSLIWLYVTVTYIMLKLWFENSS